MYLQVFLFKLFFLKSFTKKELSEKGYLKFKSNLISLETASKLSIIKYRMSSLSIMLSRINTCKGVFFVSV